MPRAASSPAGIAFAGMTAMLAAMGIGRFVYTPVLPGMMEGLGLEASQAGLIASANFLGYLVGAVGAVGGWAEGRERLLASVALIVSAALLLAMAAANDLALFLAIRFVAGVASAFMMVFLSGLVFRALGDAGRADLEVWHFGGVGLGIAISAVAIEASHRMSPDWRLGWIAAGIVALAASLPALSFLRERTPAKAALRPVSEPRLPATGPMRAMILAYGLFGLGYIVTATFLVAIVRQGEGTRGLETMVWLATGLAAAPSVWLWGRVAPLIGATGIVALGCLVEAAGVAASVLIPAPVGPLVGGVLLGGTFVAITAFGLQAARRLAGASPRRALALMTAAFGLGQVLGPLLAGALADASGSFLLPSLGAAIALLAAAGVAWFLGNPRKEPRARS